MTLSVNDFTAGDVITASAMNTNFATIEGYVNSSPGLASLTGATFSGTVTFNAGITSTGGTTALGTTTATTLTTSGAGASASNIQITFAENYKIYADNAGAGSDNSRLWIDGPDNGEVCIGPRGGSEFLHQMRLRATTVAVEGICTVSGAETVTGLLTANGGLTLVGGVSGANPVTKVAYNASAGVATEASNTTNNPVIYICTADPAADCTDGDIWIQR